MATITIRKEYADGDILFGSDLDAIIEDIETFLNTTRINDDNIQNAGITASDKLVDATVTASKLASNAVTTTKILDDAVTQAKIGDAAVGTAQIIDLNVTAGKLAADAVTTAKILDANVTLAKMAANSVGTSNIVNDAVTQDKIGDAAVGTAQLIDANVTRVKLTGGTTTVTYSDTYVAGTYTLGSYAFSGRPFLFIWQPGTLSIGGSGLTITINTTAATLFSGTTGTSYAAGYLKYYASHTAGTYDLRITVPGGGSQSGTFAIVEL